MTDVVAAPGRSSWMAVQAVCCPKCNAGFARPCESTGGGNRATVPTHKGRRVRMEHWTSEQRGRYGEVAFLYRRRPWDAPADIVAEAEAAAKPIPVKTAKQPTPKGVRLSERQAEEIERAAANAGNTSASTAHFHGDAADRQTVHALRDKGILAEGDLFDHGYHRRYTLTEFGWQVYHQHRLIIRRSQP